MTLPRKLLKTFAMLALSCAIFLTACFIVESIWGITYDTRTVEVLVAALIILHVAVPSLGKHLSKRRKGSQPQ